MLSRHGHGPRLLRTLIVVLVGVLAPMLLVATRTTSTLSLGILVVIIVATHVSRVRLLRVAANSSAVKVLII